MWSKGGAGVQKTAAKGGGKRNRAQAIREAARGLFLQRGYKLTTIDQIARGAGYSKRSVYLDFPTKDDLFLSIATDGLELLVAQLREIPGHSLGLEEYVDCYLMTLAHFACEKRDYFTLLAVEVTPEVIANCSEEVRSRAREIEQAGVALMAGRLARAVAEHQIAQADPGEVAEIVIGAAVGIIMLTLGGSQAMLAPENLNAKVRKMGRLMTRGLLAGE